MTQATFQSRRLVVIPMKDPTQAKTRLADSLAPEERAALARTLFRATVERMQTAIAELAVDPVEVEIATVTSSPEIARIASELQIHLINEGRCNSLNAALTHAGGWATAKGYDALCVLPGDLADPTPADLARLLCHPLQDTRATAQAVLCPASDLGTNALLTPLPCPFDFAYGVKSVIAHSNAIEAAGLTPVILPLASLRIDVDRQSDLSHLKSPNLYWAGGLPQ